MTLLERCSYILLVRDPGRQAAVVGSWDLHRLSLDQSLWFLPFLPRKVSYPLDQAEPELVYLVVRGLVGLRIALLLRVFLEARRKEALLMLDRLLVFSAIRAKGLEMELLTRGHKNLGIRVRLEAGGFERTGLRNMAARQCVIDGIMQ